MSGTCPRACPWAQLQGEFLISERFLFISRHSAWVSITYQMYIVHLVPPVQTNPFPIILFIFALLIHFQINWENAGDFFLHQYILLLAVCNFFQKLSNLTRSWSNNPHACLMWSKVIGTQLIVSSSTLSQKQCVNFFSKAVKLNKTHVKFEMLGWQ